MTCHPVPFRRPSLFLRIAIASACAGCLPLLSIAAQADPGKAAPGATTTGSKQAKADGRKAFYVRFGKGRQAAAEQAARNEGGEITHRFPEVDAIAVMLPEAAADRLAAIDHVALVEPVPEHALAAQVVPWNIDQFQARDIWDKDRDGNVDPGEADGSGVKFCIIDTGFYYDIDGPGPDTGHDDFVGVTASGISQITGEAWHFDGNGHGTHVAGTANAMNDTVGVVGVMPGGAELFIVKFFNNDGVGVAGQSNLGAAAYACRDAGANVISMSLGSATPSNTEEAIFQDLYDNHGIVNIAAAGNDGNIDASYPASYASVVSVGAIDENELAASFTQYPASAFGTPVDTTPRANTEWDVVELAGGGVQILSTVPAPNGSVPIYQATSDGVVYSGAHIEEAGLGTVVSDLVSGGRCRNADPAQDWSGKVVLCERGDVAFSEKVDRVRSQGGLAALIYNNVAGSFAGTCAGACTQPSIPAISLSQAQGQQLLATAVNESTEVVADDGSGCTSCNGGYDFKSGTSMATPGVAAAVGFIWNSCGGPATVTNKQIRQLLRDTAKDLQGTQPETGQVYGTGWDRVTGWGLVQLRDALELGDTRFGGDCPILLTVAPSQHEMCTASTDSTQFTVTLDDRFSGSATLSASGLPGGSSGSFGTNPVVNPQTSSVYTLSGLTGNSGVHTLQFDAVDDAAPANSAQGFALLNTFGAAPAAPSGSTPAHGAAGVAIQPTLTWTAVADSTAYTLEIATDAGFSNIVYSTPVSGTSHTVASALAPNTQHHWRVRAANICGDGTISTSRSFTTANVVCTVVNSTNVPLAILDATGNPNSPTPVVTSSTLSSAVTGTLVDVDVVGLAGTHTYISDLSFNLVSPAATSVQVMARSCAAEDNFSLDLDDEAAGAAGGWPCPPVGGASYRPSNPLSGFDGQAANGTWGLQITDSGRQDTGTLQGWGLNLCVIPPAANQAPTADAASGSTDEDSAFPITLAGSDPDGDSLTYAIAGGPANGSLSGTGANITYTPLADFNGADSFTFTVNDGTVDSAPATVSITVNPVNDAPATTGIPDQASDEGDAVTLDVNDAFADIDGDGLAFATTSGLPDGLGFSAGVFSGTLSFVAAGSYPILVTASDGSGGSVDASFTWVVNDIDQGAAVANDDSANVAEDSSNNAIAVLANDAADPDDDSLAVDAVGAAANGSTTFTASGVSYTPNADYCGADAFTYTITGGDTATVSVDVTCIDDAAVATDDSATVDEDSSNNAIDVLANDTDAEGDAIAVTGVGTAANGGTAFTAGGVTYTPTADYCGADAFTYTITGGASATVSVTVTCIDDAAVANDDSATVDEDSSNNAINVLANDTDADSSPAITGVGAASNGSTAFTAVGVSYTPDADFCGADAFAYTITGGASATVAVTVTCVNDAPVAVGSLPDRIATEGEPVAYATSAGFADVDAGDTLGFSATGLPASLSIDPVSGQIGGTLAAGDANGSPYAVVVTATDAGGASVQQSFALSVLAGGPVGGDIFKDGFE